MVVIRNAGGSDEDSKIERLVDLMMSNPMMQQMLAGMLPPALRTPAALKQAFSDPAFKARMAQMVKMTVRKEHIVSFRRRVGFSRRRVARLPL